MPERQEKIDSEKTEAREDKISRYAELIEQYLKGQIIPHSESDIIKEVLKIKLDTDDDIPSSKHDLDMLAEIRGSLRTLVSQRKVFQTLVLDPQTKEQTAYYIWEKGK
ncbi:MAG: hypothetical protein GEU26_15545 [Nitrososphaeraceae archaeon]|nr:hypothetical protein [Nitrososphaeraceae archaeon]